MQPSSRVMPEHRATVTCPSCGLNETFSKLAAARYYVEEHREQTGHEPDWELSRLASGVERAGDSAGICGQCDPDSTFATPDPTVDDR